LLAKKIALALPKDLVELLLLMPPTNQLISFHFFVMVAFPDPNWKLVNKIGLVRPKNPQEL
jgi:hypothetical protein